MMLGGGGGGRGRVSGSGRGRGRGIGRDNDPSSLAQIMTATTTTHLMMPNPTLVVGEDDDEEFLFPKARDERVPQWSQQETRDLISIRAELERDFTVTKRNKTLWELVSARMRELGYRRSADQCKCKWKNLVNRYKGKETSEPDTGRQCPFFDELHAVITEREKNMQQMLLESETGFMQAKKRGKRISRDQSSEELSDYEDDDEEESDGQRVTSSSNPRKRKVGKDKRSRTAALDKAVSRQPSSSAININSSANSLGSLQEMLQEFLQQQQRIEMMWRESIERHAYERQMFEQEWRQSMEKLERDRLMAEQAWREREEQRRMREDSRTENRDALLTMLLNKLIRENPH